MVTGVSNVNHRKTWSDQEYVDAQTAKMGTKAIKPEGQVTKTADGEFTHAGMCLSSFYILADFAKVIFLHLIYFYPHIRRHVFFYP